jgi:hypothetical protein
VISTFQQQQFTYNITRIPIFTGTYSQLPLYYEEGGLKKYIYIMLMWSYFGQFCRRNIVQTFFFFRSPLDQPTRTPQIKFQSTVRTVVACTKNYSVASSFCRNKSYRIPTPSQIFVIVYIHTYTHTRAHHTHTQTHTHTHTHKHDASTFTIWQDWSNKKIVKAMNTVFKENLAYHL